METIQSMVGHADMEMTQHYLHVQEEVRQAAAEKFSKTFKVSIFLVFLRLSVHIKIVD